MNCPTRTTFATAVLIAGALGSHETSAQTTFRNYRCADGTQFVVGFFQYDPRAHLQLDGKAVTLARRVALSGQRYSGGGVTLRVDRAGPATLKRARRPATSCEPT